MITRTIKFFEIYLYSKMAFRSTIISIILLVAFVISVSCSCNSNECKRKRNDRIFGGDSSERNSRPFQVALTLRVGTGGELGFCGGSLIHQQWVLTAAHCCFHGDQKITHGQVILGAHSLYDRFENGRRMIEVGEIVIHPDWDPLTFSNDLALLRLANIAQASNTINIIRLPYLDTVTWNFGGTAAIASGWGIGAEGVTFISPTLREKLMIVMTDDLCNTTYMEQLPEHVVCAFRTDSGTCKGDNGGPLTIVFNRSEEIILIGVASFVEADGCNNHLPSVFTRVQNYLPWISEITGITLD